MIVGNTHVSQDHTSSTSSLCLRCANASKIDSRNEENNHSFSCSHSSLPECCSHGHLIVRRAKGHAQLMMRFASYKVDHTLPMLCLYFAPMYVASGICHVSPDARQCQWSLRSNHQSASWCCVQADQGHHSVIRVLLRCWLAIIPDTACQLGLHNLKNQFLTSAVTILFHLQAFGMMGWRLGYIAYPNADSAADPEVGFQMSKVQDTIPICVTQMSQVAALGALQAGSPWVREQVQGLSSNRSV